MTPQIPDNSLLSIQFEDFLIRPRRNRSSKYELLIAGQELNTVWFEDRPLRGYGHFDFDKITGKSAWRALFGNDNPNSILSGQGKSLIFETGFFRQLSDDSYASRIKILGRGQRQDAITGRWEGASLLIDPTGVSASNDSIMDTVYALLGVVGVSGVALAVLVPLLNSRTQAAAEEEAEAAESLIIDYNNQIQAVTEEIVELVNQAPLSVDNRLSVQGFIDELAKIEKKIADRVDLLGDEVSPESFNELRLLANMRQERITDLTEIVPDNVAKSIRRLSATIIDEQKGFARATDDLEFHSIVRDNAAEQLSESEALSVPENYDQWIQRDLDSSQGDSNEFFSKVWSRQQDEFFDQYRALSGSDAYQQRLPGFMKRIVNKIDADIRSISGSDEVSESFDGVVKLASEEFTVDQNALFSGNNLLDQVKSSMYDAGYQNSVESFDVYVRGEQFQSEASAPIKAVLNGGLPSDEEALGAIDFVSVGVDGGLPITEGIASEIGGDDLLAEIGLDLIEIAALL